MTLAQDTHLYDYTKKWLRNYATEGEDGVIGGERDYSPLTNPDAVHLFWAWLYDYLPREDFVRSRSQPLPLIFQLHRIAWDDFAASVEQLAQSLIMEDYYMSWLDVQLQADATALEASLYKTPWYRRLFHPKAVKNRG